MTSGHDGIRHFCARPSAANASCRGGSSTGRMIFNGGVLTCFSNSGSCSPRRSTRGPKAGGRGCVRKSPPMRGWGSWKSTAKSGPGGPSRPPSLSRRTRSWTAVSRSSGQDTGEALCPRARMVNSPPVFFADLFAVLGFAGAARLPECPEPCGTRISGQRRRGAGQFPGQHQSGTCAFRPLSRPSGVQRHGGSHDRCFMSESELFRSTGSRRGTGTLHLLRWAELLDGHGKEPMWQETRWWEFRPDSSQDAELPLGQAQDARAPAGMRMDDDPCQECTGRFRRPPPVAARPGPARAGAWMG